MDANIRVAVVDDDPSFREGVVYLFSTCPNIEVVAQGVSAQEAAEIVKGRNVDVVVIDINIPGGKITALETIAAICAETKVLILTGSVDEADVSSAFHSGASGYAVKGVSDSKLLHALRSVYQGERYLSPCFDARLLPENCKTRFNGRMFGEPSRGNDELASFVGVRRCDKDTGPRFELSTETAKQYIRDVFEKLRVQNRLKNALLVKGSPSAPSGRPKTLGERGSPDA